MMNCSSLRATVKKGTLHNIKQYFDHKGVSSNIMECFNKATELLHFATKGFTVVAAMDLQLMRPLMHFHPLQVIDEIS